MDERVTFEREIALMDFETPGSVNSNPVTKGASKVIDAAKRQGEQIDEVDAFLAVRRNLYTVALVGTNFQITLPRSYEWTARYTNRALSEGALGAAINQIYLGGAKAEQVRQAYQKALGHGVRYVPATSQKQDEGALHMLIICPQELMRIAAELNLPPKSMTEKWRIKFGEAKMIEFALGSAQMSFATLAPLFSQKQLDTAKMAPEMIRFLLDKHMESMIEVAKTHSAAAPWRSAFKRNLAVYQGEREPAISDFDRVPLSEWAKAVTDIAITARDKINAQIRRQREEDRKYNRNEYLRPHQIKVDDVAKFILDNFEPTHTEQLQPNSWTVHGGMQLTNIKNEPIYLLRVESGRVIFQHLGDQKFYEQSLEGFSQEQLFSIFVQAGQKAQGAIALTQWVIGLAGAVFPPVRYGVIATDVLNAAFKLQANKLELERAYESMKLSYSNIDGLIPGILPKLWDAVLDKRNVALFNPLRNPDLGAWLKAIIRLVMERQARVVSVSYASTAVTGFLNKAWAGIRKGISALWEVVKHVIILAPPVVGSTGVSGQRALDIAEQRLKELGVIQAAAIVIQIKQLSSADQDRLVREIQDFINNGTKLLDVIKKSMAW
jgi:hypothetical protein